MPGALFLGVGGGLCVSTMLGDQSIGRRLDFGFGDKERSKSKLPCMPSCHGYNQDS